MVVGEVYLHSRRINMANAQAKIRIDLQNQIIDIEGTETFVKETLEKLDLQILGKSVGRGSVSAPAQAQSTQEKNKSDTSTGGKKPKAKTAKKSSNIKIDPVDTSRKGNVPSLSEFLSEKFGEYKSATMQELTVVMIYYLIKYKSLSGVNGGNILSCFQNIGMKKPTNVMQIFNNIVNRTGYIEVAEEARTYRCNVAGENFVEHDLPRKKG